MSSDETVLADGARRDGDLRGNGEVRGDGEGWRDLTPLMRPRSIAVVGASQREVRANRVLRTLNAVGYTGEIYPINPNYAEVLGLRCYPDLASTPTPADCAVVAIPAARVADALDGAVAAGVRSAIILAAGFGEIGAAGQALQQRLEALSNDRGIVICGPNCFGVLNVWDRTAPFIGVIPIPLVAGNIGLVSQSGGLTNVIVPPLMARAVGFSHVVSCGNQAGATIEDFLSFLVDDDATEVIAAFVEGFRRPRALLAVAAKARARGKPIVILKVGTSEVARQTALAHTASVVGSSEVVEAALRQHGIIQVSSLNELIETLVLLSLTATRERFAWGRRAGVITGTGGFMAYLGDASAEIGIELPALGDASQARLTEVLPGFVGATNPLDGTGAMYEDPTLFPEMLERLAEEPAIDVVAVHLDFNPRNADGRDTARSQFVPDIVRVAPTLSKPVVLFTARPGSLIDLDISTALRTAGVALLDGAEEALLALRHMAEHRADGAGQVRGAHDPRGWGADQPRISLGGAIPDLTTLPSGWLDSPTAFALLNAAGIPVPDRQLARSAEAAVAAASRVGYPVALKVESRSIQHKSDVGGVALGLDGPEAVRAGFDRIMAQVAERAPDAIVDGVIVEQMGSAGIEMLLGVKRDPGFGPVVAVGLGGLFVEIFDDVAVGLPPLSDAEARAMLQRLRSWPLLNGARGGPPADVAALVRAIRSLGDLAIALGERIEAIDVNPLLVFPTGRGVLAVDALVELR